MHDDEKMAESFQPVAKVSDIPRKKCRRYVVDGQELLIAHTAEGYYAISNVCSHADARLDQGRLRGVRIICPLHRAAFDVRDGRVLRAPATEPVRSFPLRIVDETLEVSLD